MNDREKTYENAASELQKTRSCHQVFRPQNNPSMEECGIIYHYRPPNNRVATEI